MSLSNTKLFLAALVSVSAASVIANAQTGGTSPAVAPDAPTIVPAKRGTGPREMDSQAYKEQQNPISQSQAIDQSQVPRGRTMMPGPMMSQDRQTTQEQRQGMMPGQRHAQMMGSTGAPIGFVLVDEPMVAEFTNLPVAFLEDARNDYQAKNFAAASADLKATARILNVMTRSNLQGNAKQHLSMAIADLTKLSSEVSNQQITDANQFNSRLSQIAYHNAEYHRLAAENLWRNQQYRVAGYSLQHSVDSIEFSNDVLGRSLQKNVSSTIRDARSVADKLISGSGWTTSEVGRTLDQLGTAVSRIGQQVGQRAPASSGDMFIEDTESGTTTDSQMRDQWPDDSESNLNEEKSAPSDVKK